MNISYILVLIISVLTLFGAGWISKRINGSWFFPGAFFPLLWSVYMSISFLLAPEFHPQILGVIMIVLFSIIVTVGANIIPFYLFVTPCNLNYCYRIINYCEIG